MLQTSSSVFVVYRRKTLTGSPCKPRLKVRLQKEHRLLLRKHHQIQHKATAPTPAPTDPKPGTSTDPTQDPTQEPAEDPTQDPTQAPGEVEIKLTQYVKDYRAAGKVWLDTVLQEKQRAYDTLYDRLQQLGTPHKEGLDQADKEQVLVALKIGQVCS